MRDTPGSCMVTPINCSAISMVILLCDTNRNWVLLAILFTTSQNLCAFESSKGASTSSIKQNGDGLSLNKAHTNAIAVNAFNVAMFPTLIQLGVLGQVLRNPKVARRLAKSDKESISIVMEAFKDAIRLAGPLSLTQATRDTGQAIGGAVEQSLQEFNPEIADTVEQLNKTLQTSQNTPLSNNLDIPDVMPVNPTAQNNQTPISRSLLGGSSLNEDIAQSLGRLA